MGNFVEQPERVVQQAKLDVHGDERVGDEEAADAVSRSMGDVTVDDPAVANRAMADAELDEAAEGDGVRLEARRGEVREQRERGREGPLSTKTVEGGEERVRVRLRVEAAAAAPASGGKAVARETFEQGVHHILEVQAQRWRVISVVATNMRPHQTV
jgi:hypothetical protein